MTEPERNYCDQRGVIAYDYAKTCLELCGRKEWERLLLDSLNTGLYLVPNHTGKADDEFKLDLVTKEQFLREY